MNTTSSAFFSWAQAMNARQAWALIAAGVWAAPAHVEVDPGFANELREYGYSHVDAHH